MKLTSENGESILIGANNTSAFMKWLREKFANPTRLNASVVLAVGNNWDKLGHEGTCFRGDLIDFLWNRQGQTVQFSLE